MKLRLLAFTGRGFALAKRLAEDLGGEAARCSPPFTLQQWTEDAFSQADALIYVGAVGIAVRAIAPHVKSKAADPAVVVIDELGKYAIPLLSGHLGGANDMARRAAGLIGAVAVVTTATDLNGVFAVDEWAKNQGCAVAETERIKRVSSRLLSGETARYFSPWPVTGRMPEGLASSTLEECDFALSVRRDGRDILHLVPPVLVLGLGCKKGTEAQAIEEAFRGFLDRNGIFPQAVHKVCSIDLKAEEQGILDFCLTRHLPFETFSADALRQVPGAFSASAFVGQVTGVDNVCERSAVLGAGGGGLLVRKTAGNGITFALAQEPFYPKWS